jgi:hypothetical protein
VHDGATSVKASLGQFADRLAETVALLPEPRPKSLHALAFAPSARREIGDWLGWQNSLEQLLKPYTLKARFPPARATCLAAALSAALREQDIELTVPDIGWAGSEAGEAGVVWLRSLGDAVAAAVEELIDRSRCPVVLLHPAWRRVARPERCSEIQQKLENWNRAAIVGMSGTGKTFLAREYFDAYAAEPKRWFDAPKPAGYGAVTEGEFCQLAMEVFDWLAGQVRGPAGGEIDNVRRRFAELATPIAAAIGAEERGTNARDVARLIRDSVDAAPRNARALVLVVAEFVRRTWRLNIVAEAIKIVVTLLPRGSRGDLIHTLIIDDGWSLVEACPLVDALAPPEPQPRWPIRLLITSQERDAAMPSGSADEKLRSRSVFLDDDETDKQAFALNLIAAWAAPGNDDLAAAETHARIAGFKSELLDHPQMNLINRIICRLEYHPLAIAAIASAWREQKLDWSDITGALNRDDPLAWDFDDARQLNDAHRNVLRALWRVVELSLEPADRERYLDLIIQRRGSGPVHAAVFEYLWRHRRRAGELFLLVGQGNPIRHKFAPLMLVQEHGTEHILHDMHRLVIGGMLREKGRSAAAERHRDLLTAAALLDDADRLMIDDPADYVITDADPVIPCSERYQLHLRLDEPRAGEREVLSQYFGDELLHHVKAVVVLPGLDRAEWQLLTSLPFLQAQLDRED